MATQHGAEVLTLLPSLTSSFKISQASEWMGTITEDRNVAISGLTGRTAAMTPLEIKMGSNTYRVRMTQLTGWKWTAPTSGYYEVAVAAGQTVTSKDYLEQKTTTLTASAALAT